MQRILFIVLIGILCVVAARVLTADTLPASGTEAGVHQLVDSAPVVAPEARNEGEPSEVALRPPKPPSQALNSPGEDVDFSSYLTNGRVTIVYFYADWCPACRQTSPMLANINLEDPDTQVLYLDIGEWRSPIAERYGVSFVPYLRIYDPRGALVLEGRAATDWVWQGDRRSPIR